MSQQKPDPKQMEQISRQLEDQLRKQVYEAINDFLNEDPLPNNAPTQAAQSGSTQPKQGQAEQMGNMFQSLANFITDAVRFSTNTMDQQKRKLLRQAQQQMQAQMNQNPANPGASNTPSSNGDPSKPSR
ncbi:hypothetical protein [Desmospora activa]|uniref:Uncharacterized protein n=1 Tax=Desmospora activa DSM 45169 TaxID=1121389 RepID=A0A2T4Z7Q6_9BACL|nr:hypothetical protein [Desmospora activa]PTM57920.1 hypothetical protein C8J48_0486 [Desmospora activa DSM 45169]